MEEIYVIKLRGLPPSSPDSSPSGSPPGETRDLLYDSILGLGVLHLVLGLVSVLLGSLGLAVEYEAGQMGAGLWCGLVFLAAGLCSVLASRRRHRSALMKVCFSMSVTSAVMAAVYLAVACLGVAYFHSRPRGPHEMARVGGNTIVTAFLELTVSVLSACVSARTLWPCYWLCVSCGGARQKVIVSANVLGGDDQGLDGALTAVRQISPNCVISFGAPEDDKCHWSSTDSVMDSSDASSLGEEVDRGDEYVESENWRNVVQANIIPYYAKDYSAGS